MSEDWKLGDLALCIDASPPRDLCGNGGLEHHYAVHNLVEGKVYTVTTYVPCNCGKHAGLGDAAYKAGGSVDRFRKIKPDQHEPCEEEFTELLKRSKRPVVANG